VDKQIQVVPAILTDDPEALKDMVRQAETFTDYVQFDIMDGQFVPSKSITYKHLAVLTTKLKWEAHLMVKKPEDYLEGFQQAGAKKLIFHYEATPSPLKVITQVRSLGMEVGLAVNPDTPISKISPLVDNLDSVLFLSVYPGFYGKKFIPEVLDKVADLRNIYPEVEIGIDGGIKEGNIAQVVRAGVNVIYIGSAIFHQEYPGESYHRLMKLAQEGLSNEANK
jgi:ribulose-phosphate 3-epimerase